MISIIAGVVDFEVIPYGAYVSNVSDHNLKSSLMPLQNLNRAKNSKSLESYLTKWKDLINKPVEEFYRSYVLFDSAGRFVSRKGFKLLGATGASKTKMQQQNIDSKNTKWSSKYRLTIDVPEYVFVTQDALSKLFANSKIFVAFVNSIEGRSGDMECFREDSQLISLTDESIFNQTDKEEVHPYWRLRKLCKFKNHL